MVIGSVSDDEVDSAESAVLETFSLAAGQRCFLEIPRESFDNQRGQFSSELFLRAILAMKPPTAMRVLGVTGVDLFIPMMSFVFGQAQLNGSAAVVSTARLRQEFYGFPRDSDLTLHRLAVEAVHEIGHTFGLTHCLDRACPMSLSTSLQLLDRKGTTLCPACRALLREYRVPSHVQH